MPEQCLWDSTVPANQSPRQRCLSPNPYTPAANGYWRLIVWTPATCRSVEARSARCCHEDWLLVSGQRPAVTETFTDNIPIIRSIAVGLHRVCPVGFATNESAPAILSSSVPSQRASTCAGGQRVPVAR